MSDMSDMSTTCQDMGCRLLRGGGVHVLGSTVSKFCMQGEIESMSTYECERVPQDAQRDAHNRKRMLFPELDGIKRQSSIALYSLCYGAYWVCTETMPLWRQYAK